MLSIAGLGVAATPLAGRIIDRHGSRPALLLSAASVLSVTLLLFSINERTGAYWTFFALAFFGLGSGFGNLSLWRSPTNGVPAGGGPFPAGRCSATGLFGREETEQERRVALALDEAPFYRAEAVRQKRLR